jgi:hypothetical protein
MLTLTFGTIRMAKFHTQSRRVKLKAACRYILLFVPKKILFER